MAEENDETRGEINTATSAKIGVYKHWLFTLRDIQWEIKEFEYDLEYQRYERDVTQRLYDAATDEKQRKHWQKQLNRIDKAIPDTEAELTKVAKQAAYCEAMIAIIQDDLETEGIDLDECDLDIFFSLDDFDDEFDDDELPF